MNAQAGLNRHNAAIEWARATIRKTEVAAEFASRASNSTTYRLKANRAVLGFLKIGSARDLTGERDRLVWLRDRVAVPSVLGFATEASEDWLLTSPLHGCDLSRPDHTAQPHRLVRLLASALKRLHSLDPASCPFLGRGGGRVVVHGDACLPNFVFDATDFAGYLDVGDLRIDRPEVDLAAAVWSLDHNLGAGFGGEFLREYGWHADDDDTVESFRRSYETV